ncbi:craniofacial development protein 2-like [Argonauta hians]
MGIQCRNQKSRRKFVFGSWNVHTLQDSSDAPERKTTLASLELSKHNIDVAALSETRLSGTSQFREEKGGYVFFTNGKSPDEPRHSGVGFAIKSELACSLQSLPKGCSDRIITLSLELELGTRVTLVSCYAPTMNRPDREKDDFYQHLREVINAICHRDKLILMWDFNARVGADSQAWRGVWGHHGVGKMNVNGLRLLSLCREFNFTITNTVFQ